MNEPIAQRRPSSFAGIVWKQWLEHGRVNSHIIATWLIGVWILPIFNHPGWICGLGLLYAMWVGNNSGGSEIAEGSEEFISALPSTRTERYMARLALSGLILAGLLIVGLLAIAFNVPQGLWMSVVESGFTNPNPEVPTLTYWLCFAWPAAVFGLTFLYASTATSTTQTRLAPFTACGTLIGIFASAAFVRYCLFDIPYENSVFSSWTVAFALLGIAPASLILGFDRYRRKEAITKVEGIGLGSQTFLYLMIFAMILVILIGMFEQRQAVAAIP